MCEFINLSGISSDQILNSPLIEYKDNVKGLLFIIPMLITVEQLINCYMKQSTNIPSAPTFINLFINLNGFSVLRHILFPCYHLTVYYGQPIKHGREEVNFPAL